MVPDPPGTQFPRFAGNTDQTGQIVCEGSFTDLQPLARGQRRLHCNPPGSDSFGIRMYVLNLLRSLESPSHACCCVLMFNNSVARKRPGPCSGPVSRFGCCRRTLQAASVQRMLHPLDKTRDTTNTCRHPCGGRSQVSVQTFRRSSLRSVPDVWLQ